MKQLVSWHEKCLINSKNYADKFRKEIKEKQKELTKLDEENVFLETQINVAKKRKFVGFDATRFLKKRVKKVND